MLSASHMDTEFTSITKGALILHTNLSWSVTREEAKAKHSLKGTESRGFNTYRLA